MRQPKTELLLMLCGTFAAIIILKYGFGGERAFDQAALGNLTVQYLAKDSEGMPIHTIHQTPQEVESIQKTVIAGQQTVFFFGNSQTHSINQKVQGDRNYPEIIDEQHPEMNILVHSLPNASLQEFLVLFQWWSSRLKIDQVFIPVFMDDLREDGIRKNFMPFVIKDQFFVTTSNNRLAEKLNGELKGFRMPEESAVIGGETGASTPQDLTEKKLNDWLSNKFEVWANRPNARGEFFMKLYEYRNTLLGINASTKRKVIPARYDWNIQALEAIIEFAEVNDIYLTIYIPPIRTDVEIPYDLNEYARFKHELTDLVKKNKVSFADLEGIVPGKFWGFKASTNSSHEPEIDFMHFQGEGHEILANSLQKLLEQKP